LVGSKKILVKVIENLYLHSKELELGKMCSDIAILIELWSNQDQNQLE